MPSNNSNKTKPKPVLICYEIVQTKPNPTKPINSTYELIHAHTRLVNVDVGHDDDDEDDHNDEDDGNYHKY